MTPEIIQIGIAEVDVRALQITRSASYYVRPVNSTISEYCTHLTGITPEIVQKKGRPIWEVLASIEKTFGPAFKTCFAWGRDGDALDAACHHHDYENPFNMVNLGQLFTLTYGLESALCLEAALTHLGRTFEGTAHDAGVDAVNTARLHMAMLQQARRAQTDEEMRTPFMPSDDVCWVCGSGVKCGSEPRFGPVVCVLHRNVTPVEAGNGLFRPK